MIIDLISIVTPRSCLINIVYVSFPKCGSHKIMVSPIIMCLILSASISLKDNKRFNAQHFSLVICGVAGVALGLGIAKVRTEMYRMHCILLFGGLNLFGHDFGDSS